MAQEPNTQELQAFIQGDPKAIQLLQAIQGGRRGNFQSGPGSVGDAIKEFTDYLTQNGFEIPHDYSVGQGGDVTKDGWFKRNMTWLLPLAMVGGGLAAGALTAGAVPGAAATTGATTTAAETAGGLLPSTPWTTPVTLPAQAGGAAASSSGGWLSRIGNLLSGEGEDNILGDIGDIIGAGTKDAAAGRLAGDQVGVLANNSNISGRQAFENQQKARAELEATQRDDAEKDVYRAGWYQNRKAGPFTPKGALPNISANYMNTLGALEQEAFKRLQTPAQYDTRNFTPLKPYEDYKTQDAGTLEKIGNWASPIAKIGGKILGSIF